MTTTMYHNTSMLLTGVYCYIFVGPDSCDAGAGHPQQRRICRLGLPKRGINEMRKFI